MLAVSRRLTLGGCREARLDETCRQARPHSDMTGVAVAAQHFLFTTMCSQVLTNSAHGGTQGGRVTLKIAHAQIGKHL